MKKLEIEYDERRSLESTVDQLQSLVDGLRSGALTIARGDRRLLFLLKPDAPLEFTLHAERSGERERLKLSLEWQRQHLRIGGGRAMAEADSAEAAASARELAEHEDPSELEQIDAIDEDDDDFDDAAETLRHGHQLAQALRDSPLERH
jgi:amphi-Trp domain-containing protein